MKYLLILMSLLWANSLCSQTVSLAYRASTDLRGNLQEPIASYYMLEYSNGKSLQRHYLSASSPERTTNKDGSSVRFVKVRDDTTYIYKDFALRKLVSVETIFLKQYYVSDDLDLFNWKILSDTLTVLNYKCKKATTTFRGRNYEAWFTEDIPISDGPRKFNGLPGLILKVRLVDPVAVWDIEAIELRTEKTSRDIANPYEGKSIVPYERYRKEYNAKHKEFESFQDDSFKIHRGGIEIIDE